MPDSGPEKLIQPSWAYLSSHGQDKIYRITEPGLRVSHLEILPSERGGRPMLPQLIKEIINCDYFGCGIARTWRKLREERPERRRVALIRLIL